MSPPVTPTASQLTPAGRCALSADIREEPDWHAKVDDPEQREAWRAKALAKNEAEPRPEWRLTKRMVRSRSRGPWLG